MTTAHQFGFEFSSAELTEFGALVFILYASVCPAHVIRSVIAVHINAIKSMADWTLTNISQKVLKFLPTLANFNAAATVISISRCIWIAASLMHGFPCAVKRMLISACRMSMAKTASAPLSTSASNGVASSKFFASDGMKVSTIAFAQPSCLIVSAVFGTLNYNQSSKSLACDIYRNSFGHRTAPLISPHIVAHLGGRSDANHFQ